MSDLNDPRVLFAAERTLLAWSRTSLTLMTLGFAVERFDLVLQMLHPGLAPRGVGPFAIALCLLVLGVAMSFLSVIQFRRIVATLRPAEMPAGYWLWLGMGLNIGLGVIGAALMLILFLERA